jgi:hypothetical protein
MITWNGTRPQPHVARAVYEYSDGGVSFIAPWFMLPMMEDTGQLPRVMREKLMPSGDGSDGDTGRRAPGSAYKRDKMDAKGVPFTCVGHGHEVPMPDEHQAIYGSLFNTLVAGGEQGRMQLMADLEVRFKNTIFDTSVWTGTKLYKDYSGAPWDTAGTDILGQVAFAKEKHRQNTGMEANAIVMGATPYRHCWMTNTAIKGKFSGWSDSNPQRVRDSLALYFDLEYVLVGSGVVNTAAEGASAMNISDIWGDDYVMVGRVPTPDQMRNPRAISMARVPTWASMGTGTDVKIGAYRENQTKSDIVQCDLYTDEIVLDKYFGFLMKIDA